MNVLLISELRNIIIIFIESFCTNDLLYLSSLSVANQENDPIQWLSFALSQSGQQKPD